ncbi:5615_t:CDS:1, partial [Gigaspora margarita]
MRFDSLQNLQVFSSQFDQNKLQEHLGDIQTLVYLMIKITIIEQNLYEQALDSAEYENDNY